MPRRRRSSDSSTSTTTTTPAPTAGNPSRPAAPDPVPGSASLTTASPSHALATSSTTYTPPYIAVPRRTHKTGRETIATPERLATVLRYVRQGNYWRTAFHCAGISEPATVYRWFKEADDEPDNPNHQWKRDFKHALIQAEAEAEAELLERVRTDGAGDWKSSLTVMARRHRDRWAEQTVSTGESGKGITINIGLAVPGAGQVSSQVIDAEVVSVPELPEP